MKELGDIFNAIAQQFTFPLMGFIAFWIWKTDRNVLLMRYQLTEAISKHKEINERLDHVEDTLLMKCPIWEKQRRSRSGGD